MKTLVLLLLVITLRVNAHDHPSVHGMLVIGSETVYLSHLPMFHSPHDYQVILEVKISKEALSIYQASLRSSSEKVYTLVPEVFILPEMIQNPHPFKAQLFKGPFERGGQLVANDLKVEISKVVYFKKINPNESRPKLGQYLVFGNTQEQFLAHLITRKPDFDQVLKLASIMPINTLGKIEFPINDLTPINEFSDIGSLEIDYEIYLERGDLSM